jgi:hypothetical protein
MKYGLALRTDNWATQNVPFIADSFTSRLLFSSFTSQIFSILVVLMQRSILCGGVDIGWHLHLDTLGRKHTIAKEAASNTSAIGLFESRILTSQESKSGLNTTTHYITEINKKDITHKKPHYALRSSRYGD